MLYLYRAQSCFFSCLVFLIAISSASPGACRPDPADWTQSFFGTDSSRTQIAESPLEGKPIIDITVLGKPRLDKKIALRLVGLSKGDYYIAEEAAKGLRRIERMASVDSAFLRAVPADTGVRLFILLTEAQTRKVRPLISRRLTNKWMFGLLFSEKNLRGKEERISASLMIRRGTLARASWSKPFFTERYTVEAGFSASFEDYEYSFPDFRDRLLDEQVRRFEAAIHVRLTAMDLFSFFISPGIYRIDTTDSITAGHEESGVPETPTGTFTTMEVGFEVSGTGSEVYPTSGFELAFSRKDWGLLQKDAAIRNFLYRSRGALYLRAWKPIVALNGGAALTHGRIPLTLLQHLGGEGSIRGLEYGRLSGSNCIYGSAELRVPLNFREVSELGNPIVLVDFHLFADGGACWSPPGKLDYDNLFSGFGCGFNMIPLSNALLKIDYAWRRSTSGRWQLDAAIPF